MVEVVSRFFAFFVISQRRRRFCASNDAKMMIMSVRVADVIIGASGNEMKLLEAQNEERTKPERIRPASYPHDHIRSSSTQSGGGLLYHSSWRAFSGPSSTPNRAGCPPLILDHPRRPPRPFLSRTAPRAGVSFCLSLRSPLPGTA